MTNSNRNAPELIIEGDKWVQEKEQRISVAERLIHAIGTNKKLNANDRLLLIIFLGQASGFHPSEQWIIEHTGMSADTYHSSREKLNKLNYITYEKYKFIKINIENIEDG